MPLFLADFWTGVNSGVQSMLIFWGAITILTVAPIVCTYLYRLKKAELNAALKHDMLARGMSADDIERVLKSRDD